MQLLFLSFSNNPYIQGLIDFFMDQLWLLSVLIVLICAMLLTYGTNILHQQLRHKRIKSEYGWLFKIAAKSFYWPLIIFFWIEALTLAISFLTGNQENLLLPS